MAIFIDRHPAVRVPREVRRQVTEEALENRVDVHGARPIGHWLEDGYLYCVMEAPNTEAFCQHHADHHLPCDDLHQINGLEGTRPIPARDDALVRASIEKFWHLARA